MKRKPFRVEKEIKAIARERVGSPKPARPILPKGDRKRPKYKKSELLQLEQSETSSQ